jgi:hypothetical protein
MILSTLNIIESAKSDPGLSCRAYCRGEVSTTVDPRTAVAQLYEPRLSNPICLVGFKLPIIADGLLTTPLALSEFVESFDEADQQILLTPKFCLTDLHLDSADGISVTMGKCEKVWLCFPPTTHNLQLMQKVEGQKSKLMRIGKDLEGGMIFKTDSTQAIYLPVGTIHAVFTLVGGFLIAIDFTTPTSAKTYAALLRAELDGSGTFQETIFERFLSSVSLGLDNNKVIESVSAWIDGFERLKRRAVEEKEWATTAQEVWDEFLRNWKGKKIACPCGKMGRQNFAEHFSTYHALTQSKKRIVRSKRKREDDSGPFITSTKRSKK